MIQILVILLVIGVVLYLISIIPMDAVLRRVVYTLAILFTIIWILEEFGLLTGVHVR